VEKIKSLDRYQKAVLIFMGLMAIGFLVLYAVTISRVGFEYEGTVLVPSSENGSTVYSGKIKGQQACFTVSADKTVLFQYGDKSYGPYRAKEDPSAIPQGEVLAEDMLGVELLQGESILFRGGVLAFDDGYWLFNEDGLLNNLEVSCVTSYGLEGDGAVDAIDPMAPSAYTILQLMSEPKLTHKGEWSAWFAAAFICALNVLTILFADELFRWDLHFRIRNADRAEPSDLEIAGRYIGWTTLTIVALVVFILGLQ